MVAAAADSSHFDAWMTVVGAGIALAASLATAGLSAFFEYRRDAARRAHADRHEAEVRFHADRLATYVEFVGVLTTISAAARVWLKNGAHGRFKDSGGLDAERYVESLARTRMLAKPPLLERTIEVDELVYQLLSEEKSPETKAMVADALTLAVSAFEKAVKKELGIE